jgi:ABC transport system ATP-binding/permease protein
MNLISAENITQSAGERYLFKGQNFGLNRGNRIGLIGVNGTGKTTLLNILAGVNPPESGKVSVRKDTRLAYLGQNPDLVETDTVMVNVFRNNHPLNALVAKYEELINSTRVDEKYLEELDRVTQEMTQREAWSYEHRVKEIISRLGIGEYLHQPVNQLSGGQRKRVALARILAEEPEVLILDEPTNHLDIETVEWLQHLISDQFETVIMVTHDRYFLDGVTNTIIELENGEFYRYDGNYAYYLEKKAARDEALMAETEKVRNTYRRELEWMRRQPKARTTKSRARIDAFDVLKERIAGPAVEEKVKLDVKDRYQGGKIVEVHKVSKSLGGKKLISQFTHHFLPKERVGILGPNGAGKTTLLKMITGQLAPDEGKIVAGDNTMFGYYSQEDQFSASDLGKRVLEVVTDIAEFMTLADGSKLGAVQFLTRFKFPPKDQYKTVDKLSGGEKRRLQLLRILVRNPNFLILDEPTNDLDITTLNVLEEFLESFKGTVLLVSHDRYFMDRLVDHVFVFEEGGHIRDFPGNYTEYRAWKEEKAEAEKELKKREVQKATLPPPKVKEAPARRKLTFKEQQRLKAAEEAMAKSEVRKEEIHTQLATLTDHQQIAALGRELETVTAEYDAAMLEWLELSE